MSHYIKRLKDRRGQSLVTMALFSPVLVIILAGLIEVTQLAVTQNRISTAARNAARYAANGGEDAGMRNTIMNTITSTLVMSSGDWDVWSIRAEVDAAGDIQADSFIFDHIYGDGLTEEYDAVNAPGFEDELRIRVQDELQKDNSGTVVGDLGADLDVVGTYILHDIEAILGLNLLRDLLGFNTVTGYSIMRRASLAATVFTTGGCRGVFPIAVEDSIHTITESEYDDLDFNSEVAKPRWETFPDQPASPTPLQSAREGNIFKVEPIGYGAENFGWLRWNTTIDDIEQGNYSIVGWSLVWPGNSDDYEIKAGDSPSDAFRGFEDVLDPDDHELHEDNWIFEDEDGFGGAEVKETIVDHIEKKRALRVVLWNESDGGYTSSRFQSSGFGIFRIRGFKENEFILLELVRIDNSCGQS